MDGQFILNGKEVDRDAMRAHIAATGRPLVYRSAPGDTAAKLFDFGLGIPYQYPFDELEDLVPIFKDDQISEFVLFFAKEPS